jgi:hypothetical protein
VSPWPNRTRSRGVPLLPVSPWPNRTGHLVATLLAVSPWPNRTGLAETATREMFAQGDIRSSPTALTREMFAQGDAPDARGWPTPRRSLRATRRAARDPNGRPPPALPGHSGRAVHAFGIGVIRVPPSWPPRSAGRSRACDRRPTSTSTPRVPPSAASAVCTLCTKPTSRLVRPLGWRRRWAPRSHPPERTQAPEEHRATGGPPRRPRAPGHRRSTQAPESARPPEQHRATGGAPRRPRALRLAPGSPGGMAG